MPSWKIFDEQEQASARTSKALFRRRHQSSRSRPERHFAGTSTSAANGGVIGIDRFGASAPGAIALEKLGINVANVVEHAKKLGKEVATRGDVMRIAIAADHAGFSAEGRGPRTPEEVRRIRGYGPGRIQHRAFGLSGLCRIGGQGAGCAGEADQGGILICGSGVGVCIAANKMPGIRAGMCHDTYSAHQGVEHDEMNVLVLGARIIGPSAAFESVDALPEGELHRPRRAFCAPAEQGEGH